MTKLPAPCAEDTVDLIVLGSGAAGLAAAVTAAIHGLRVVVLEQAEVAGGTSAWSGGWIFAPRNRVARRAGIDEPPEAPRAYLQAVAGNRFRADRVDAFLAAAPEMVAFFEQNTALQFQGGLTIPDTYGHLPGAGQGGRGDVRHTAPCCSEARFWPVRSLYRCAGYPRHWSPECPHRALGVQPKRSARCNCAMSLPRYGGVARQAIF